MCELTSYPAKEGNKMTSASANRIRVADTLVRLDRVIALNRDRRWLPQPRVIDLESRGLRLKARLERELNRGRVH